MKKKSKVKYKIYDKVNSQILYDVKLNKSKIELFRNRLGPWTKEFSGTKSGTIKVSNDSVVIELENNQVYYLDYSEAATLKTLLNLLNKIDINAFTKLKIVPVDNNK